MVYTGVLHFVSAHAGYGLTTLSAFQKSPV
jgi:hypothetical protein